MSSKSAYLLVFDLSVMHDPDQAQRQYAYLAKWAHAIAHQNLSSNEDDSFHVIVVGTHLDRFPDDTVPPALLEEVSNNVRRLVGVQLGDHMMLPAGPAPTLVPFFQVGSVKRIGLRALSQALHDAGVRQLRAVPLEYVCVQDLLGRAARLGEIPLVSTVAGFHSLKLSSEPEIRVSDLMPDSAEVSTKLLWYLEDAADILVCRENSLSRKVKRTDTIVLDVPRLIAVVELLCSVVMARWEQVESERARNMLAKVIEAGNAIDLPRTERLLKALDNSRTRADKGIPREVAEWLVWTAASTNSSNDPLLAGARVDDVPVLMQSLERLSLVYAHDQRLLAPMLLPETAAVAPAAPAELAVLFVYQMSKIVDGWEELPVPLATFHLVMVALWRKCLPGSPIDATQRCTNFLTMNGCAPMRLRLNYGESFIRVELQSDESRKCEMTLATLQTLCESTDTQRWGWRGKFVAVPAHPHQPEGIAARPLFPPEHVALNCEPFRERNTVQEELSRVPEKTQLQCNISLSRWWVKPEGMNSK